MEDEFDSSTKELLFLPFTELELFCESSPDFIDEEDFDFSTEEEDLPLLELFCELEDSSPLEAGMTEDLQI